MRTKTKEATIRQAAQRLFLKNGLRQTSMDAVAAEAKVAKQTVYSYYPSKDKLFVEVLRHLTAERLESDILELMPSTKMSVQQLQTTLLELAERLLERLLDPTYLALLRVIVAESKDFPELAGLFRNTVISQGAAALADLLKAKQVSDIVRVKHLEAARRLFVGPLLSYVLGGLLGNPKEVAALARAELPALVELYVTAISHESTRIKLKR
jgi:TetR/AcrR family transcriptional regulator, mexJK operon transcriptional repressor